MKRFLSTALVAVSLSAPAAAQSLKDSPLTWTGPYAGVVIGYGKGDAEQTQTNGGMPKGPFQYDVDGPLGGVVLGYNHQLDRLVIGAELEGGYMDATGDGRIASSVPTKYQALWTDGGLYAIASGRVGFAWDRSLIYAKGGYAWFDGEAGQKTTNPGFKTFTGDGWSGWTYGGGIEHMLTDRVSVKLEYMRLDLGSVDGHQLSITDVPVGFKYTNETDLVIDTVKLGVNFKF